MKLHYITIAIIVVSMITLGVTQYITDLGENYATTADFSGIEKTEGRLEAQQEAAQDLSDEITGFQLESVGDFFAIPYKMIKIGWYSAKTMFNSWITVGTIITESEEGLSENGIPFPSWVVPSIIAIIIMILVAIVIYAFFKWKFED